MSADRFEDWPTPLLWVALVGYSLVGLLLLAAGGAVVVLLWRLATGDLS